RAEPAVSITAISSAAVCGLGSPDDPNTEVPFSPPSRYLLASRSLALRPGDPTAGHGLTTGATAPRLRLRAGSKRAGPGLPGVARDLLRERGRQHDDALRVADEHVAGHDEHAGARDRDVRVERVMEQRERRPVWRAGVHGQAQRGERRAVAQPAVRDDAGGAAP